MYAVVIDYTFDYGTEVHLFKDVKEAKQFLEADFKKAVETEERESTRGVDHNFTHYDEEIGYAELYWNDSGSDMMSWTLTDIITEH